MEILLNKEKWELKGYWPWVPFKDRSMETGQKLKGVTDWFPATVPGGVHYDLYREGWIEYPFKDLNSLKCEWVENRWWLYRTYFTVPNEDHEKIELIFKGLDYEASIFLNGKLLGEHKGMYHPARFDITSLAKKGDEQELLVLFKGIPQEMGQIGKTSKTRTQKARFNYKWDFSTRMVNIGIWDDVILKIHRAYSLDEVALHTDVEDKRGILNLELCLQKNTKEETGNLGARLSVFDPEKRKIGEKLIDISDRERKKKVRWKFDSPELWYPNGYGQQPLYKLKIELLAGSETMDEREYKFGFRSLRYEQNQGSPEESLPYTIVINGKKIYIKGVNITPLDHLYGTVSPEHYEYLVRKMKEADVNLVRVWGGGIIEKELFYDLCDEYGILVWQDFIQSSSGIDNIPSKVPEFLDLMQETARAALTTRRNHVSLAVWCGGNELMSAPNKPSTYDDINIKILKEMVEVYDPGRLFLPTSASGPVEFITKKKGISHDIHGHWHYLGNPEHYEIYGQSDSLFHSEFGVDGVSSIKTLNKILSKEHHYPTPMSGNLIWRHHGEWWGTYYRDCEIFSEIKEINNFVKCSQWVQAEGLRYILEANRRRKFHNSGSIIWQLNEPWPNASCTNLIEYFGETKMAYHWAKKAYAPLNVSLDYEKLDYKPGSRFEGSIYLSSNSSMKKPVKITVEVLTDKGEILLEEEYSYNVSGNKTIKVGELCFNIDLEPENLFFVRLKAIQNKNLLHTNLYIFSTIEENVYRPAMEIPATNLEVKPLGEWEEKKPDSHFLKGPFMSREYCLKNTGDNVALHVFPLEKSDGFWLEVEDAYFTLFPGESKHIKITALKKQGGGLLSEDIKEARKPEIVFDYFNK